MATLLGKRSTPFLDLSPTPLRGITRSTGPLASNNQLYNPPSSHGHAATVGGSSGRGESSGRSSNSGKLLSTTDVLSTPKAIAFPFRDHPRKDPGDLSNEHHAQRRHSIDLTDVSSPPVSGKLWLRGRIGYAFSIRYCH